jgi:hypothetical protein
MLQNRGNARFVYHKQQIENLDIAKAISQIDLLISKTQKMQKAADEIILSFDTSSHHNNFKDSSVYVGREVLGHDQELLSFLHYLDTLEREVHIENLPITTDYSLLFQSCSQRLPLQQNHWRIIIQDDFSKMELEF